MPPDPIGPEALLLNSHHLKMQESINDRFFLLLWSFRRPAVFTLWQIIVLPLDDPTFPFCLRDIQMSHMETVVQLSKGERSSTSLRVELDASEVDFAVLREDAVPAK